MSKSLLIEWLLPFLGISLEAGLILPALPCLLSFAAGFSLMPALDVALG